MSGLPTVSVIIPCYNAQAFVGQAIESALGQTSPPTEVIVVDDGSTDDSHLIANRFGSPVRALRQRNGGPSLARNAGIEASTGQFIAFLDADDYWMPSKLETQLPYFQDPEVGLVHSYHRWVYPNGQCQDIREHTRGDAFHALLERCTVGILTAVAPRRVFDDVGLFDPDLRGSEDWDMWLRVALKYRIEVVPQVLASYRWHTANSSHNHRRIAGELFKVLRKHKGHHGNCRACARGVARGVRNIRECYSARAIHDALAASRGGRTDVRQLVDGVLLSPRSVTRPALYSVAARMVLNAIGAKV